MKEGGGNEGKFEIMNSGEGGGWWRCCEAACLSAPTQTSVAEKWCLLGGWGELSQNSLGCLNFKEFNKHANTKQSRKEDL